MSNAYQGIYYLSYLELEGFIWLPLLDEICNWLYYTEETDKLRKELTIA